MITHNIRLSTKMVVQYELPVMSKAAGIGVESHGGVITVVGVGEVEAVVVKREVHGLDEVPFVGDKLWGGRSVH